MGSCIMWDDVITGKGGGGGMIGNKFKRVGREVQ